MSRVKETCDVIDDMKSAMIGDITKPTLYLIPILCDIALSLSVIADGINPDISNRFMSHIPESEVR